MGAGSRKTKIIERKRGKKKKKEEEEEEIERGGKGKGLERKEEGIYYTRVSVVHYISYHVPGTLYKVLFSML